MSPRYFQGYSVTGPVTASTAQDFSAVVDKLRLPPNLGISRENFHKLNEEERNEKKRVPFFVPACFKTSPSKRDYASATHCNLIFLDIDPEKELRGGKWVETGRFPAAPFVNNPETLYTALAGYNFAAHVTASSTPERPRMRIIVDADRIPLSAYPRAAMAISALLGLPAVTKESKVSVQPMFLPVWFSDSTEEEHPLIAHHLDGRYYTVKDIGEELFPEYDKTSNSGSTTGADHSLDALEFLRAQVPEIKLATAREALFTIDPDVSRAEWYNCAMALKHQFAPHIEDEALELFDEWSAQGEKYRGEKEIQQLWDSIRPTPIGRAPITIRSLLRTAEAAGWDDKRIKEECFSSLVTWLDNVGTITELMDKGIKRILATPLLSSMQEDALLQMLCSNAKKRFATPISVSSIRKDVARLKAEIKAQEKPLDKIRDPAWTKNVFYVSRVQEFFRHHTGEKLKPDAFDAAYSRWLLPSEDTLKEAGIPITPATLSKPIVAPTDYALNHLKLPAVYDYAYDPSQPTEMFFVNDGKRFVNIYCPTYPELDGRHAGQAGESLQNHLAKLISEPDYTRTIIDFMAFMVQFPGRKIRWAVFIQGAEGAGKTYLAEVMRAVLGKGHVRVIGDETIKKGWTEWSFGKQLVVLEEIYATGSSRHATMNLLKGLITNAHIPIEQRNRDSREEENRTNYLLFSNHHDALALTPNDRRYFVVKSALQDRAQALALGEDYFIELFGLLEKMPGAFRSFLLDWHVSSEFRPDGHAPRTTYVSEMVNDSASDVQAAVRRMLVEADYPLLQYDICSSKTILDALHLEEGMTRATSQQISNILREEGLRQLGRFMIAGERHYIWARHGIDDEKAVDRAADRVKNNLVHLCTDLLW